MGLSKGIVFFTDHSYYNKLLDDLTDFLNDTERKKIR